MLNTAVKCSALQTAKYPPNVGPLYIAVPSSSEFGFSTVRRLFWLFLLNELWFLGLKRAVHPQKFMSVLLKTLAQQ